MVEYTQEELWELAAKIPSYRADSIAADLSMHGIDAKGWVPTVNTKFMQSYLYLCKALVITY